MEVIEHVNSPMNFIEDISFFVKSGGYLFISTINKTQKSYLNAIFLGERLTGIIPNGTHEWEKFIEPEKLVNILEENNFTIKNISGVSYNPFTSNMKLVEDKSVNYILMAQKNN